MVILVSSLSPCRSLTWSKQQADSTWVVAWAVEYDTATNTWRTQEVASKPCCRIQRLVVYPFTDPDFAVTSLTYSLPSANTFCAGGNTLGNGTVLISGGNKAVTYGGEPDLSVNAHIRRRRIL